MDGSRGARWCRAEKPYARGRSHAGDGSPGGAPGPVPAGVADPGLAADDLVEWVRVWAEFRLAECSIRALAQEVGISKSALDQFVLGGATPERNWPRLRAWYLRDRHARRHSLQEPSSIALLVLETVSMIPRRGRAEAIRSLVGHFETLHHEARAPRPEWLDVLAGWAASQDGVADAAAPSARARRSAASRRGGG